MSMVKSGDRPESREWGSERDRMAGQVTSREKKDPKKMLNSGNEPKKLFKINDLTF